MMLADLIGDMKYVVFKMDNGLLTLAEVVSRTKTDKMSVGKKSLADVFQIIASFCELKKHSGK